MEFADKLYSNVLMAFYILLRYNLQTLNIELNYVKTEAKDSSIKSQVLNSFCYVKSLQINMI